MGHAENAAGAAAGKLARAPIKKFGNEIVCYNRNAAEDHDSAAFFCISITKLKYIAIDIMRTG